MTSRRLGADLDVQSQREQACRTLPCVCGAAVGEVCTYPELVGRRNSYVWFSHTSRYDAAAARGLVPALPGGTA